MFKAFDKWLIPYLRRSRRPAVPVTDVLLCVCDHFEPFHRTDAAEALHRVRDWAGRYPGVQRGAEDADGRLPRHTFFYPIEQYDPAVFAELERLCRLTGNETEVHLHHDGDTPASLTERLEQGKVDLRRHGFLGTDPQGRVRYGFIHGNWALDNSRPDGRWCGVNTELTVLHETGCYADFTLPSAPSSTQTPTINSIYAATDTPTARSHEQGRRVRAGEVTVDALLAGQDELAQDVRQLLLVQGPLGLNWRRRKWGLLPRVENGDLTGHNPWRLDRYQLWVELGVHVAGRPEWIFIKLHTHGAVPRNSSMLLGSPAQAFLAQAARWTRERFGARLHHVSARELVNVVQAARAGCAGNPGAYRDFWLGRPPLLEGGR